MSKNYVEDESIVMQFIRDFFNTYDKSRHMLHTFFTVDSTFIMLGNRISGQERIQQAICTMASTTHELKSIDIHRLPISITENIFMFQVLCTGSVEFGGDPQCHEFTASLLICFRKPNIMNIISLGERCLWAKLT